MVVVALLVATAPVASAATPLTASCASMMQAGPAGPHSCCGSGCECSLKVPKTPVEQDVPASQERIGLSSTPLFDRVSTMVSAGQDSARPAIEGSPPKDTPLYEEYSEYRL
jgi:hypothetical protein